MKLLLPIIIYIATTIAIFQNWLVVAGILVVGFSFRFGALPFIPLAIFIDGYFGNFYVVPWLSLGSIVWYGLVGYLRPKIANIRT